MNIGAPTFQGFVWFIRNNMGIPEAVIADDSVYMQGAYTASMQWVPQNAGLELVLMWYQLAVYNLGGSFLIRFAQDIPPSTYFADLRKTFGMNIAVNAGLISSAADESTSTSMAVSDAMSNLSLADLQMMQDPYGRQALAILMELGPLWGYS